MITLRIQEITQAPARTLEELSERSQVPLEKIKTYTTIDDVTEEIAENLQKIAMQLN